MHPRAIVYQCANTSSVCNDPSTAMGTAAAQESRQHAMIDGHSGAERWQRRQRGGAARHQGLLTACVAVYRSAMSYRSRSRSPRGRSRSRSPPKGPPPGPREAPTGCSLLIRRLAPDATCVVSEGPGICLWGRHRGITCAAWGAVRAPRTSAAPQQRRSRAGAACSKRRWTAAVGLSHRREWRRSQLAPAPPQRPWGGSPSATLSEPCAPLLSSAATDRPPTDRPSLCSLRRLLAPAASTTCATPPSATAA